MVVKVVAFVLAAVLVICIIGSLVYIGVKVFDYMTSQNFDFSMAWEWAINDYKETFLNNISGAAADDYWEYRYKVNEYVNIVGCTYLK